MGVNNEKDGEYSSSSSDDGVRRGLVEVWKLENTADNNQSVI